MTIPREGSVDELVRGALTRFRFEVPWDDLDGDARRLAARLTEELGEGRVRGLELVRAPFFRGKGAYLVGAVHTDAAPRPFLAALTNPDGRIAVDAVLLTRNEVSIVFSFARSYFFVDITRPRELVEFLSRIMPLKPVSELYNAIGFNKHGKTELYRTLLRYLADSDTRFEIAPGQRGMVMCVFTLPGFDVVFKVIRDRFGAPKTTTRAEVIDRYRLVARLDRAGRLLDAQEFEHLEFERSRFSPRLLERLRAVAGASVEAGSVRVAIRHLYTERRVTPLDLHLATAGEQEAIAAVLDYGRAIKDLAASNVFPGDLLTKNFGVTRHGRVVFYDYDEITTLDRCRFRSLPDSADGDGAGDGAPFFVDPADVFPEELGRFLGFGGRRRAAFLDAHGDLFTTGFWLDVQARIRAGELPDLFPYPAERRLRAPA
jgi:isocitrate dehydrogenase kinase/phosphatase